METPRIGPEDSLLRITGVTVKFQGSGFMALQWSPSPCGGLENRYFNAWANALELHGMQDANELGSCSSSKALM